MLYARKQGGVIVGRARSQRWRSRHRTESGSLLVLAAALTFAGCVSRETLVILPATMTTPPSARNHPEGTAFVLRENATLTARVKFRSVSQWGLTVTARAEPGSDAAWPTLRIELDGVPAQTLVVHDRRAMSYWLRFVAEPGFADLNLSMARADAATHGATVVIERVEIVPL